MSQLSRSESGRLSLPKRIRQELEHLAAQGVTLGVTGLTENPVLGYLAGGAFQAAEHRLDNYIFPDIPDATMVKYGTRKTTSYKKRSNMRGKASRVPRSLARAGGEIKHFDYISNGNLEVTSLYKIFSLGAWPVQGLDYINRIGRKIKIVGLHIQCQYTVPTPAQVYLTGDTIKCELFRDNATKGGTAIGSAIYDTTQTSVANYSSPRLVENIKRFTRLHTSSHAVVVTVTSGSTVVATANSAVMEINLRLNDIITFNSNTGAVADVTNKSYIMSVAHMQSNIASAAYSVQFYSRFNYIDM